MILLVISLVIVSKLFRAYRLYNGAMNKVTINLVCVSKLFRAYRLYNPITLIDVGGTDEWFQSSFELTGYITALSFLLYAFDL